MAGRSVVPSIADSSQQMSPPNGPRGTYLKRRCRRRCCCLR